MKTKVAAVASLVVLAGGYVVVDQVRHQPTTQELAKPRKYRLDEKPEERGVVVIQLCWLPKGDAQFSVGWALGSVSTSIDRVGPPLTCQTPWARKAVLGKGDRVTIGWTLISGPVSKVKYRISINNRPRIEVETMKNTLMYSCTVGTPPCELP